MVNHEKHERHEHGCTGFLSCSWCFSWFTDSRHDERKGLTTKNTKDTKKDAPVFLSCGWCFSWFTESGHDELKGLTTKNTKDTKMGARVFFRVVGAFRGSPIPVTAR
jgi:hypothetical protein